MWMHQRVFIVLYCTWSVISINCMLSVWIAVLQPEPVGSGVLWMMAACQVGHPPAFQILFLLLLLIALWSVCTITRCAAGRQTAGKRRFY